jgi:hypothetical protein
MLSAGSAGRFYTNRLAALKRPEFTSLRFMGRSAILSFFLQASLPFGAVGA